MDSNISVWGKHRLDSNISAQVVFHQSLLQITIFVRPLTTYPACSNSNSETDAVGACGLENS